MFYRLRLNINSTTKPPAQKLKEYVWKSWSFAKTINPGQDNSEPSTLVFEKCYHDEDPSKPCEILYQTQTPP